MKRRNVFGAITAFVAAAVTGKVSTKDGILDYAHYVTINARPDLPQSIEVKFSGQDIVCAKEVKLEPRTGVGADEWRLIWEHRWSAMKKACMVASGEYEKQEMWKHDGSYPIKDKYFLDTEFLEWKRGGIDCVVLSHEILHDYRYIGTDENGKEMFECIDYLPISYGVLRG